ncbi:MAG: hypothetical protein DMG98_20835 [Acidobacteria bacterium]|nr:MAG: hypothetical protein DMG98_20835 [Acidobacteriota bacterium]
MISQQVSYNDLGDLYLDELNKHHLTRNLIHPGTFRLLSNIDTLRKKQRRREFSWQGVGGSNPLSPTNFF